MVDEIIKDEQAASGVDPLKTVPYDRFSTVNNAKREAESALAAANARLQELEDKRLEELQEWEKLANSRKEELDRLKAAAERTDGLHSALENTVKSRIEAIPPQLRGLVPEYDDPTKTLAWLDANTQLLGKPFASSTDAGIQGDSSGVKHVKLTELERMVIREAGMSEEDYAKMRTARGANSYGNSALEELLGKADNG